MRGLKKALSVILCIVLIFGSAPLAGFVGLNFPSFGELFALKAKAETQSGTVGDNITWTLDIETGVLTISGEGDMPSNYWDNEEVLSPWYNNELIKTVIIENGITSIDEIELKFHIYDSDTYDTIADTDPIKFSAK